MFSGKRQKEINKMFLKQEKKIVNVTSGMGKLMWSERSMPATPITVSGCHPGLGLRA